MCAYARAKRFATNYKSIIYADICKNYYDLFGIITTFSESTHVNTCVSVIYDTECVFFSIITTFSELLRPFRKALT